MYLCYIPSPGRKGGERNGKAGRTRAALGGVIQAGKRWEAREQMLTIMRSAAWWQLWTGFPSNPWQFVYN
jgi:hypothetical protein